MHLFKKTYTIWEVSIGSGIKLELISWDIIDPYYCALVIWNTLSSSGYRNEWNLQQSKLGLDI